MLEDCFLLPEKKRFALGKVPLPPGLLRLRGTPLISHKSLHWACARPVETSQPRQHPSEHHNNDKHSNKNEELRFVLGTTTKGEKIQIPHI